MAGGVTAAPVTRLARLGSWLAVDRAVRWTLLVRAWQGLALVMTAAAVSIGLSLEEQGYYVTFLSVLGVQIAFELSMPTVIQQFASHEAALLDVSLAGVRDGEPLALARLGSLLRLGLGWYLAAGALMMLLAAPAGVLLFSSARGTVTWLLPWLLVVAGTSGLMIASPLLALLEGCGFIADVAALRFGQEVAGGIVLVTCLLSGAGLLSLPISVLAKAGCTFVWLRFRAGGLLRALWRSRGGPGVRWREVWRFQWRLALSSLSSLFIGYLINPVLFAFQGAVVAGRTGLSLTVANGLLGVAMAWAVTKAPTFANLVARGDLIGLERLYASVRVRASVVAAAGALGLVGGFVALAPAVPAIADRFLPPGLFALLAAVAVLNQWTYAQALYLRAFKEELFWMTALLLSACMASSTYYFGRYHSVTEVLAGYVVITFLVSFVGNNLIFEHFRRTHRKKNEER